MSVSDFEQLLGSCIKKNEHVIEKLNELTEEMEHHHTVCNSVKTVGTTAGVFGTALMATSLLAAPFTGGASLLIAGGAAVCSIGGAATNVVTGVVDRKKTKSIINEVQSLINSRNEITSALERQSNLLNNIIEYLVSNDLNEQTAFYTIFSALANGRCNLKAKNTSPGDFQGLVAMGRLIQTEFDLFKSLEATSKTVAAVSKAAPGINQMILKSAPLLAEEATKLGLVGTSAVSGGSQALKTGAEALKTGGQATGGLVKTLATAAVVTSVVITVVDVAFLIRDWASDHPTIDMIQNVVKQLNVETKNFRHLLSTLDQLRERVYFANIENIPIIGAIDCINDVLVALLNQDIYRCIQILQEIDIEWPFNSTMSVDQLVDFLLQWQVASGFDPVRLKTIVQQRGKKAQKSIKCLVREIVEKVKAQAAETQQANANRQRSSRGEHVINNNVLSVQRDIIDMFLQQKLRKSFGQLTRIPVESAIYRAYHYPFQSQTRTDIESVMVARIPDDVFYFDANASLYGILIYILRISAKDHMIYFYDNPGVQGSPSTSRFRTTRLLMNEIPAYVDQFALNYWLTRNGGNRTTYDRSKLEVYRMFLNLDDQIRIWVQELKRFGY